MKVDELVQLLEGFRYDQTSEATFQLGVQTVLAAADVPYEREVILSATDRIDFVVAGAIGIELKVGGSPTQLLRQMHRYAQADQLQAVILLTTRRAHLVGQPEVLNGKPIRWVVVATRGGFA